MQRRRLAITLALASTLAVVLISQATSASHAATNTPVFHPPSRADDPRVETIQGSETYVTEPATVVTSDGTRYVAYQSGSQLSWTRDGGQHWTHVGGNEPTNVLTKNITGCTSNSDIGDVDLATDQAGRVYFADLQITDGPNVDNGIQPVVATSADRFGHYSGTCAAHQAASVDREWLAAWTPPGKSADSSHVYLSYHDFSINTIWVNASHDGGKTWLPPVNAITSPAAQLASFCDTVPAGTAIDPRNGWVYVAWTAGSDPGDNIGTGCNYTQGAAFNNLFVAVSKDNGATWTDSLAFHGPNWSAPNPSDMSEIFASIATDRSGGVYLSFPGYLDGNYQMWALYSPAADGAGALHFGAPIKVNDPSVKTAYFGRIVAGDRGRLEVLYLGSPTANVVATPTNIAAYPGTDASVPNCNPLVTEPTHGGKLLGKPCELPAATKWYAYVAQSLDFTSSSPTVTNMKLRTDPVHVGDICTVGIFCLPGDDRDLADVNDIKIDKTGGAQVAYTFETADRTHTQIDFQCQSGGPGLYAGVPVRDCHLAPVVVTNPRPPAGEPSASGGGSLASTGGLPYAVPAAFLFVLALMFTRRRRRS